MDPESFFLGVACGVLLLGMAIVAGIVLRGWLEARRYRAFDSLTPQERYDVSSDRIRLGVDPRPFVDGSFEHGSATELERAHGVHIDLPSTYWDHQLDNPRGKP
jgi:hypothetical protein